MNPAEEEIEIESTENANCKLEKKIIARTKIPVRLRNVLNILGFKIIGYIRCINIFPIITLLADANMPIWLAIGLIPIDIRIKVRRLTVGLKIAMPADAVNIKNGIITMDV